MKRPQLLTLYVAAVVLSGAVVLLGLDWIHLVALPPAHLRGFAVLLLLGLVSEHQAVSTALHFRGGGSHHSISFIPLSASVVLFGPVAPVVFIGSVGAVGEFVFRRKPLRRGLFNTSQWVVSSAIAGSVYGIWQDGIAVSGAPTGAEGWSGLVLPFLAFGLIFLLLNQTFVSLAIALSQERRFREVVQSVAGKAGATAVYDLLLAPVSLIVAVIYLQLQWWGLLLSIFPLLFIRHAYVLNLRLQEANRDLLRALVKAIETRDPYTSGHSLRVQSLAGRIAGAMGLPEFRRRNIEQAALLHDIGKIDAIYTEILKKPESLSAHEREVIESHVTKGVELLMSISKFPKEVIDSVRYHHEREDGRGYPHGLVGPEIPLGAKIINVCDAVDAMLSDRPYRSALSTDTVRAELHRYSGVQFDARVVEAVVQGDLLDEHAQQVAFEKGGHLLGPLDEPRRSGPVRVRSEDA
jgi:putative nucleotidyltransferase with HDIG domain